MFQHRVITKMNDDSRQLKSPMEALPGELRPLYVSKLRHRYQSLVNVRNPPSVQRVTQAKPFLLLFDGSSLNVLPFSKNVISVAYATL